MGKLKEERRKLQLKQVAGSLALQDIKKEVLARNDAVGTEFATNGGEGLFGCIVLLTEMAEPYMTKTWCGVLGKLKACDTVVEMSHITYYPTLQPWRVWTVMKHTEIVVGFKDKVIGR